MNKAVILERDGKQIEVVIRQMAHDTPALVGKKFKYGSGKSWMVKRIEESK